MNNEITLYKKHQTGLGEWKIWSEGDVIHIGHSTSIGGSMVRHQEKVETNQSGRTLEQQVQLRIKSRISRMLDKGYKGSINEAAISQANQMGLDRPMLAQQIAKTKNLNTKGAVLQKKLDGHRCLITRQDGEVIAYTRQGKPIPTITHITDYLQRTLPEGVTLDGELYSHGVKLQTIGSWIKRLQPATASLTFAVYDLMSQDRYVDRHKELSEIISSIGEQRSIVPLPYRPYESDEETHRWFKEVRLAGFEGLMMRLDNQGYECGIRSNGLLKIKEFDQQEFPVVGFKASGPGWAICVCQAPNGKLFDCSAPGDLAEKFEVMKNQAKYLGHYLTIDFAHWTDDGLPFQPTALRWRDDI